MARLPAGDPAPADGALPAEALAGVGTRPFGFYVHVPFCASRCGYCDFNTYVPGERGAEQAGGYVGAVLAEIDLAARVLARRAAPRRHGLLRRRHADAAVGRRADPDPAPDRRALRPRSPAPRSPPRPTPSRSIPRKLEALREAGFTRLSLGMQSAVPRVLATLERVHSPGRPQQAVAEARAAGFEQVSLDLIYGTPGETADDWRASLDAALSAEPDHLSTYSLIVEPGTRMAAQVRRGELVVPGEDGDRRPLRDRRARARRGRDGVVRDLLVGDRRGRLVPAQPRLLGRRRLVGRRAGRAQPRRRRALVERAAPAGVERAARGRHVTGGGARAARRGGGPPGARDARPAAAVGRRPRRAHARRDAPPPSATSPAGCWNRPTMPPAAPC